MNVGEVTGVIIAAIAFGSAMIAIGRYFSARQIRSLLDSLREDLGEQIEALSRSLTELSESLAKLSQTVTDMRNRAQEDREHIEELFRRREEFVKRWECKEWRQQNGRECNSGSAEEEEVRSFPPGNGSDNGGSSNGRD